MADFDNPDNGKNEFLLKDIHTDYPVKISDDEIAFSIRNKGLFIFNLGTRKLKKISNEEYYKKIYIDSINEILCSSEKGYFFIGLDEKHKRFIDFGEKSPISYLKDLDALLLEDPYDTLFPLAVKEDIWIYFLKTKKSYLIKKDFIARDLIRLN